VTLAPVAGAHGTLAVSVSATPEVSQPGPLAGGQTVVTAKTEVEIRQDRGEIVYLEGGAKLAEVVKALNLLGATPQDLLSILQALKAAGSLRAELEII
jgi:flagellar P-ring protein precursor FlgI